MNTKILVTGSSGFIGQELCKVLIDYKWRLCKALRNNDLPRSDYYSTEKIIIGNVDSKTDWTAAVSEVDCIIHCAARAHVMIETEADALNAYRIVNVNGTSRLAEQAAEAGVKRLIFLSSIKVNGEITKRVESSTLGSISSNTDTRIPSKFTHLDPSAPEDPYGISKWEAEQVLWEVSRRTGLEVVVVRPPMVYGAGVKGNFLRLLQWVERGVPLPLGGLHNKRSMISLDNLVDMLIHCVDHPDAAGQTFLVSDGEDLSTSDVIRYLSNLMGKSSPLIPVPVQLLRLAGRMTGKVAEIDRLVGSLQIDSTHTREVLNWTPPYSVQDGLRKTVEWYKGQGSKLNAMGSV